MRFLVLLLGLGLLFPGTAFARPHGRHSRRSHAGHISHARVRGHGRASKGKGKGKVSGAVHESERPVSGTPAPQAADDHAPHGPQHIDFDDRLIQGQTNKSGAVYLYDRKDLKIRSMVKQPNTFRSEIAKGLFE